AIAVFNHANEPTQLLRKQQDTVVDFQKNVVERLSDFNNRLIEIFGYPYVQDIGGSGAYPDGYIGPDLYHFNYVDIEQLAGVPAPTSLVLNYTMRNLAANSDGTLSSPVEPISFNFSSESRQFVKPPGFTSRLAPGE